MHVPGPSGYHCDFSNQHHRHLAARFTVSAAIDVTSISIALRSVLSVLTVNIMSRLAFMMMVVVMMTNSDVSEDDVGQNGFDAPAPRWSSVIRLLIYLRACWHYF